MSMYLTMSTCRITILHLRSALNFAIEDVCCCPRDTCVTFADNFVRNEGIIALADALKKNPCITELDLQRNPVPCLIGLRW